MPDRTPEAGIGGLHGARCLVIGAGGFLGTHLCRALLAAGARVQGYGRRMGDPAALADIRWTQGEFTDRTGLARSVEGVEIVFHLLGGSTPESSNADPVADLQATIAASLGLFEICRAAGTRKIVFASSGGTVYGIPRRLPIDETAATDPISAYGVSKLAVEKYLGLYRHLYRLDFAVLRIANPFGAWQDPFRRQGVVASLARAVLDRQPAEIWGDGSVVRDFVYAPDVAHAMLLAAAATGGSAVYNVGSGVGRSVLDVLASIETVIGTGPVARSHRPGRPADVPVNVLDCRLIRDELGWEATTPWETALEQTVGWLSGR